MERDLGDILDRGSIAKLKSERIKASESLEEWQAFEQEIENKSTIFFHFKIDKFFDLLYSINAQIWDSEADVRQGYLDGVLYEVGKRAIEIRKLNMLRVKVKNLINDLTNDGFQDIKQKHISA
jgi:hypothetical protein